MIVLNQQQRDEIARHSEREYPHECCGLLFGTFAAGGSAKLVSIVYPVANARADEARATRSLITPEEYLRGDRAARDRGLEVIGNYHSHPDAPAVPSAYDLAHAWPVWSYIIVSVRAGASVDLRSWKLEADRSHFNSEEINDSD